MAKRDMAKSKPRARAAIGATNYGSPLLTMSQTARENLWRQFQTDTASGSKVTHENAMEIDGVMTCVRVIAESLATLPFNLMETQGRGEKSMIEMAVDNPVHELVRHQPNPEMTAYEMRLWMMIDCLIRGRGASQVQRNARGQPVAMWPLLTKHLVPRRAPDDSRLVYTYSQVDGKSRKEILLEANEVLQIQMMPFGGLIGFSLVELQREALGASKASEQYSSEFFANGGAVSGVIEVPETLDDDAYERLRKGWKDSHTTKGKRHGVPILEGDAKFHAVSLNHEETQLLETRKFQRSTIAGLFRVPAHLINDLEKATFSNIEHQDLGFVKHTLRPWMENWAQRCRLTLLDAGERKKFFFAFDDHDLLRGDLPTRAEAISKLIQVGVFCPNDGRRMENRNPYPDGDKFFVNGTLRPIDEPLHPAPAPGVASGANPSKKPNA